MEVARKLLSSLFPSRCILCQNPVDLPDEAETIEICSHCYQHLPFNTNHCKRCALPLAEGIGADVHCGRCIKKPPVYDQVYSVLRYEAEVIRLIHSLKFKDKIIYAKTIGGFLKDVIDQKNIPDCLLPVPLHPSRMRQRGFNQSTEICRIVSKHLNLPIELKAVVRRQRTSAQSNLGIKQRQKNIKEAFQVVNKLAYDHIMIVDDVMTSGATVNELAIELKANGVSRVDVLCFARTPVKV